MALLKSTEVAVPSLSNKKTKKKTVCAGHLRRPMNEQCSMVGGLKMVCSMAKLLGKPSAAVARQTSRMGSACHIRKAESNIFYASLAGQITQRVAYILAQTVVRPSKAQAAASPNFCTGGTKQKRWENKYGEELRDKPSRSATLCPTKASQTSCCQRCVTGNACCHSKYGMARNVGMKKNGEKKKRQ